MRTLLVLTIAAMALAAPVSASAAEFTHGGKPIEEEIDVLLEGPTDMFAVGSKDGILCTTTTMVQEIESSTTGQISSYESEHCTTDEGVVAHVTPIGLPWEVQARGLHEQDILGINLHVSLRHPATTHLEVATANFAGNLIAVFSTSEPLRLVPGASTGKLLIDETFHGNLAGELKVTNTAGEATAVDAKE